MDTLRIVCILKDVCISILISTLLFGELANIELEGVARQLLDICERVVHLGGQGRQLEHAAPQVLRALQHLTTAHVQHC